MWVRFVHFVKLSSPLYNFCQCVDVYCMIWSPSPLLFPELQLLYPFQQEILISKVYANLWWTSVDDITFLATFPPPVMQKCTRACEFLHVSMLDCWFQCGITSQTGKYADVNRTTIFYNVLEQIIQILDWYLQNWYFPTWYRTCSTFLHCYQETACKSIQRIKFPSIKRIKYMLTTYYFYLVLFVN